MTAAERTALDAGFHIIVPVWGREYTQIFIELMLPTLLAPGNIPALPHPERHVFQIYTTPADRAVIEASPIHARLKQHIRVAFHRVRSHPEKGGNAYAIQSDCYRRAIREADAADQAMVFLTPDSVMADGSLRNLARIAGTGVRAVLGVGVRLVKETVSEALLQYHRGDDGVIAIGPRELVRLALPNIHPIAKAHFYHDEGYGLFLSNLYWRIGTEGLLARCFHLHPFMVYPRVKNAPFTTTVDGDYIEAACPDLADTYVVTDSDEFWAFELSAADRRIRIMDRSRPPIEFVQWMYNKTTARHRQLIGKVIRMHAGMSDGPAWRAAELEAEGCVKQLLSYVEAMAQAKGATVQASGYYSQQKLAALHFRTLLRSEAEARLFIDAALPSLIAPGNIPRLVNKRACRWRIEATSEAASVVAGAPEWAELRDHMPAEIEISQAAAAHEHRSLDYRQRVVDEAAAAGAAAFFVEHDSVFTDESLTFATRVLELGYRAVLVSLLPLRRPTALPVLRDGFWIEGLLSIGSRELARLAMQHLDARPVTGSDALLLDRAALGWRVGDEGMIVHCLEPYPLVIYPRSGLAPAPRVADDRFLGGVGLAEQEISVVTDASALMVCRLVAGSEPRAQSGDIAALASWVAANTGLYCREVFKAAIKFTAQANPGPLWPLVAAKASTTALAVLAATEVPSTAPSGGALRGA